ncbi:MAG TPA: SRPBCC domain-containing protein [Phenylobacterium sp.]|nr:SRPBCC domain-containing protein [Phenylobacterium sp.]
MSEPAYVAARFTRMADAVTAEFSLLLDNHLQEVWRELTDSERLPRWLAPGNIDLRVGGAARLDFPESGGVIDSPVTAMESLRLLAYSWSSPGEPERPLRWDLEPIGPMTRLTLRLTVPRNEDAARAAAGWAAHLEMLWAALIGTPIKFPYAAFKAAREAYTGQLARLPAEPAPV